jgi:hypothetical protein
MVIWFSFMTLCGYSTIGMYDLILATTCMIMKTQKITHWCQSMHMLNTNIMAPCEIVHDMDFAKDEIFMVAYMSIQYGAYFINHS